MSYKSWFETHGNKHKEIVNRLSKLTDNEILEYFKFENMVKQEPDFCPLYKKNKKCHDIENLNCYLCGCPNFRFNDNGFKTIENFTLFSKCNINSKHGAEFKKDGMIHQDCSKCTIPHNKEYIQKIFSKDWFKIMKYVSLTVPNS